MERGTSKFSWIGLVARIYNYIPHPSIFSNAILGIAWLFLIFLCCSCLTKSSIFARLLRVKNETTTVDVGFFGVCDQAINSTSRVCHELRNWDQTTGGLAYETSRFAWLQVHPVLLAIVVVFSTLSIVLTILKYLAPAYIRQWSISCLTTSTAACLLLALQMALAHISANSYAVGMNLTGKATAKFGVAAAVFGWISSGFFLLFSLIHLGLWTIERNKQKLFEETSLSFSL